VYRGNHVGLAEAGDRTSERHGIPDRVRSRGEIDMSFAATAGATAISRSYQSGCLRLRVPRRMELDRPCAVLINTSGGIAEGDILQQRLVWEAKSRAAVTTQAAEKVYRALLRGATIETRIEVASGAQAEWLPQETILFGRARLRRDTRVNLTGDASFLGVEAVVLGRTAMDERMRSGALRDAIRITREGRLIYADALELGGDINTMMERRAIAHGGCAMAVILHIAAKAGELLEAVRDALAGAASLVAASSWNGILAMRLIARDGSALRRDLLTALAVLRGGRPMPRVWNC
jgi:urease accessory protein